MNRIIVVIFSAFIMSAASAQTLAESGNTIKELVPEGWEFTYATGDVFKHGREDLVIVATPNDPDNMTTRDDGYVYNFNQPLLGVYCVNNDGEYVIYRQYDGVIPARTSEYVSMDVTVKINSGVITFNVSSFASAGSYQTPSHDYVFRFQEDDIYLIGEEMESFSRLTGEAEKTSINYLTRKQWISKYNMLDEPSVNANKVWSKIPKRTLRRLGSFPLTN